MMFPICSKIVRPLVEDAHTLHVVDVVTQVFGADARVRLRRHARGPIRAKACAVAHKKNVHI